MNENTKFLKWVKSYYPEYTIGDFIEHYYELSLLYTNANNIPITLPTNNCNGV